MKSRHIYLIWFIAFLPTMVLRDYTPKNEVRYLSIVDEALRNGTLFAFTNQGEIYADKPPLHFWLMMAGKQLLGEHRIWYYSLLSFIPAFIILITMNKWIGRERDEKGRERNEKGRKRGMNGESVEKKEGEASAALMLITSGFFAAATLVVRMDMLMNMFIVLSLYTFYKMYQGHGRMRDEWLFQLFVFLALFSKGPLGLLIPFVTTLTFLMYKRQLSHFTRYWGMKSLLVIVAGCLVWFFGVYLEGGKEYLYNLLVHQTVGRGIDSFHHKEPFYYYAFSLWYSLAPWSLLMVGLIIAALYKKRISNTLDQFFAAMILSTLTMLSLVSSKLAIYSLPVIPFVAYLTIRLVGSIGSQNRWIKLSLTLPAGGLLLSLPAVVYLGNNIETRYLAHWLIFAGAAVLSITGLFVLFRLYRGKETHRAINTLAVGILLAVFVVGWSMPELNSYLGWGNLCEKAKQLSSAHHIIDYQVYNISRAENMDVFLGKDIVKVSRGELLRESPGKRLLMLRVKEMSNDPELGTALSNGEKHLVGRHAIIIF